MRICPVTVGTTIVVVGFSCLGAGIDAQEAPQDRSARPITESAERMARELWPVDDHASMDEQGRPRFRASVTVTPFVLPLPWQETDPALTRFQRPGRLYHQEFLSVVTPEAFRAGALTAASGGVGVDPGAMFDGVKSVWRNWQARRARERIEREVAQLRVSTTGSTP